MNAPMHTFQFSCTCTYIFGQYDVHVDVCGLSNAQTQHRLINYGCRLVFTDLQLVVSVQLVVLPGIAPGNCREWLEQCDLRLVQERPWHLLVSAG